MMTCQGQGNGAAHGQHHNISTGDRAEPEMCDVHTVRDPYRPGPAIKRQHKQSTMYISLWQNLREPETPPQSKYIIHVIVHFTQILESFFKSFIVLKYIRSHKLRTFLTKRCIFGIVLCLTYTIFHNRKIKALVRNRETPPALRHTL